MLLHIATDGLVGDFYTKFPKSELNILTSFEYKTSLMGNDVREFNHFIADSGAFTAMASGKKIDDNYIDAYIDWIKSAHIDHFIEMDIDEIVGYEKVKQIRNRIEKATGKQSIPVWHLGRKKEGWLDMVKNYPYVALSLSGFTASSKWLKANDWKPLHFFLQTAAENGAKVHALGCTNWPLLRKFHFFSSDSSTWSLGERYGTCFMFVDGVMKNISLPSKFKKNKKTLGFHNKQQWFKAMQYAKIKM